ncbi:hypothetical protein AYI70_g10941 [Smittium culicis]|uniref:Uncharacterized protein n=1 Tax=Smittium culicis TaxID=133412 RepID=A0A1R1X464_9FUNG|nr:hypothetical protein AYI70_g10941 [Smittium culicis]
MENGKGKGKRYSAWITPQDKADFFKAEIIKSKSEIQALENIPTNNNDTQLERQNSKAALLKKKLMRRSLLPGRYDAATSTSKYSKSRYVPSQM